MTLYKIQSQMCFTLCMLGNFASLFCRRRIFSKLTLKYKSLRKNTIRVSNSLDSDQSHCSVMLDLVPTFAKRFRSGPKECCPNSWLRQIMFLKHFLKNSDAQICKQILQEYYKSDKQFGSGSKEINMASRLYIFFHAQLN